MTVVPSPEADPRPGVTGYDQDLEESRAKLSPQVARRMAEIEAVPGYGSYFHSCVPNNYVFILVPLATNRELLVERIKTLTTPLNEANEATYQYCFDIIKRMPRNEVLEHDSLIQRMGGWKRTVSTSANLQGVAFAEKVFATLADLGVDVRARWQAEVPEMRKFFTQVPDEIERLLRINISVRQDSVVGVLRQLIESVFAIPECLALIEKVEVAKPHAGDASLVNYPTLILYLVSEANDPGRRAEVEALLQRLHAVFADCPHGLAADPTYADPWHPFVTLTQGYRLWKRYLELVGLLGEIYDSDFQYAYLRPSGTPGNFPGLLSAYRHTGS